MSQSLKSFGLILPGSSVPCHNESGMAGPAHQDFFHIQDIVDLIAEKLHSGRTTNSSWPAGRESEYWLALKEGRMHFKNFRLVNSTFARAGVRPLFQDYYFGALKLGHSSDHALARLERFNWTSMAKYTRTITLHGSMWSWNRRGALEFRRGYVRGADLSSDEGNKVLFAQRLKGLILLMPKLNHIRLAYMGDAPCVDFINTTVAEMRGIQSLDIHIRRQHLKHSPLNSWNPATLRNLKRLRLCGVPGYEPTDMDELEAFKPLLEAQDLEYLEFEGKLFSNWTKLNPTIPFCRGLKKLRLVHIGIRGTNLAHVLALNSQGLRTIHLERIYLTEGTWSAVFETLSPLISQLDILHLDELSYVPSEKMGRASCICGGPGIGMYDDEAFACKSNFDQTFRKDGVAWRRLLDNASGESLVRLFTYDARVPCSSLTQMRLRIRLLCAGPKGFDQFRYICGKTLFELTCNPSPWDTRRHRGRRHSAC